MENWLEKSLCESLNSRDWGDSSAVKAFAALAETCIWFQIATLVAHNLA